MLKFKKNTPIFSEDELLNIEIKNETIQKVIIHGEYSFLEILSKNEKLKNIEPELFLSMSKIEVEDVWFKKTNNQLSISFIVLFFGFFIFKFYSFINALISLYLFYLYFIKQKKDKSKELILEAERQKYISELFENHLELKKLNLIFNFEELHTHKP